MEDKENHIEWLPQERQNCCALCHDFGVEFKAIFLLACQIFFI